MQLVTFREPVSVELRRSTGSFRVDMFPGSPWVMPDGFYSVFASRIDPLILLRSEFTHRVAPFDARHTPRGGSVLLYNGSRGLGDQLMTWPLPGILTKMGYKVHVLVDVGLESMWHVPDVVSTLSFPCQLSALDRFDHLALFEGVVNFDTHPDQEHPTDRMLTRLGIPPASVPDKMKRCAPLFTPGEVEEARRIIPDGKRVGVFQGAATSVTRSLSADASIALLRALRSEFPALEWLVSFDVATPKDWVEAVKKAQIGGVHLFSAPNPKVCMVVIARAQVVVGVDSFCIHAAGASGVPCVGLWGPMDPSRRVAYYQNHVPVWNKQECPMCPCFHPLREFPSFCPPLPEARTQCSVLGAVKTAEVCQAVRQFLR